MLPTHLLPHTVTVQTPGTATDRYGNTVQDWDSATSRTILARIEMVMTQNPNETTYGRDDVVSVWRMFTNDEIGMLDRITWGSRLFNVDGDVWPAYGAAGVDHYEAILRVR